jgi:predicted AAA+ superfamily ATPase
MIRRYLQASVLNFLQRFPVVLLTGARQVGAMVETWAAVEILKLMAVTDYRFHLYFWRTHPGREVDFLLEFGGKLVGIEVKWSSRVDESTLSSLERCHGDLKGKLLRSVVLYGGTEVVALTPKILAVPYSVFFGMQGAGSGEGRGGLEGRPVIPHPDNMLPDGSIESRVEKE